MLSFVFLKFMEIKLLAMNLPMEFLNFAHTKYIFVFCAKVSQWNQKLKGKIIYCYTQHCRDTISKRVYRKRNSQHFIIDFKDYSKLLRLLRFSKDYNTTFSMWWHKMSIIWIDRRLKCNLNSCTRNSSISSTFGLKK